MSVASLLLLLSAAILHALANVLLKRARDKLAFTWWMLALTSFCGLPIWLYAGNIEPKGWLIIVCSGVIEAVYFIALCQAYTYGDLSQVYPLARGSAPLFIVIWALAFLGEEPSAGGYLGVAVIVSGLYLINLPSLALWNRPLLHLGSRASRWALLTGLLISAYATIDKVGVGYVDPVVYLYMVMVVACAALAPAWILASRRRALMEELTGPETSRTSASLVWIGAAAFFGVAGYTLVLMAMQLSPVGYVGAVREISVVFGAWVGVRFLGESGGALRLAASVLVVAGILLIAMSG